MKKKIRTITVNNQKYVWWYGFCEGNTSLMLSPYADKTSIVKVNFPQISYIDEDCYGLMGENVLVGINMLKGGEKLGVKLFEPKGVSLVIKSITERNLECFRKNKTVTFKDGFDLLSEAGYTDFDPIYSYML